MAEPRGDLVFELGPLPEQLVSPRPVPLWRRAYDNDVTRRGLVLLALGAAWHCYASWLGNPLLVPTPADTFQALVQGFASGSLTERVLTSLGVLLFGYGAGIAVAALFTALAMASRLGRELLSTMTAMLNPLPAIALLPLSMLWFGLGTSSLVFVLVHSVVWAVALSALSGFETVSPTLRMVGRNYGLRGPSYILQILVPAACPSLIAGLKVGWAFGWRTLIAAELVFGVAAGSGGLGWFIYENKNQLEIPSVFAGLATVILIGLAVENLVFRVMERKTIERWGMRRA